MKTLGVVVLMLVFYIFGGIVFFHFEENFTWIGNPLSSFQKSPLTFSFTITILSHSTQLTARHLLRYRLNLLRHYHADHGRLWRHQPNQVRLALFQLFFPSVRRR